MKIDVGCGGRGTPYEGFTGIDVWPKATLHPDRKHRPYIQTDVVKEGIPLKDSVADFVICLQVIEHLTRPDAITMLKEIRRIMKTGAELVVTVPDLRTLCELYVRRSDWFNTKNIKGKYLFEGDTLADKLMDILTGMGEYGHK